jgi:hypothetical protein
VKTNLLERLRVAALSVALAATLSLGLGSLYLNVVTAAHGPAPHALLADGVETHGGKNPPPKNA